MCERLSISRHKRFTFSIILLLLLSTFMVVSHHHEFAMDDHDCPICVAGNHQSATDPFVVTADGIPLLTYTTIFTSEWALIDTLVPSSRSTRGPPA
jgi:hypothetical protein